MSSKLARCFGHYASEGHSAATYPPDMNPMQTATVYTPPSSTEPHLLARGSLHTQCVLLALLPPAVFIQPLVNLPHHMARFPGTQQLLVQHLECRELGLTSPRSGCSPALAIHKLKGFHPIIIIIFAQLLSGWPKAEHFQMVPAHPSSFGSFLLVGGQGRVTAAGAPHPQDHIGGGWTRGYGLLAGWRSGSP